MKQKKKHQQENSHAREALHVLTESERPPTSKQCRESQFWGVTYEKKHHCHTLKDDLGNHTKPQEINETDIRSFHGENLQQKTTHRYQQGLQRLRQ